jgi:cytoskeletal protein RodZ
MPSRSFDGRGSKLRELPSPRRWLHGHGTVASLVGWVVLVVQKYVFYFAQESKQHQQRQEHDNSDSRWDEDDSKDDEDDEQDNEIYEYDDGHGMQTIEVSAEEANDLFFPQDIFDFATKNEQQEEEEEENSDDSWRADDNEEEEEYANCFAMETSKVDVEQLEEWLYDFYQAKHGMLPDKMECRHRTPTRIQRL